MHNQNIQDFAEAICASYAPEDDLVGQGEGEGTEDTIVTIVSEKVGTREDQLDMLRMGKTPQLKVCFHGREINDAWTDRFGSVTLAFCLCLDLPVS